MFADGDETLEPPECPGTQGAPAEAHRDRHHVRGTQPAAGAEGGGANATLVPPGALSPASPASPARTLDRMSLESEESFLQPSGTSARGDLQSSKSQLRRAQNRAEELRKLFALPDDESFLDDFMCALRKKVLLQGRMYVFGEHVCFHCNLFGYIKTKCIPLREVVEVRKKKNVGFPNSIELTMENGKREFFTSLLAREEAYRLITAQWRQCSEHASHTPEATPEPEPAAESCGGDGSNGGEASNGGEGSNGGEASSNGGRVQRRSVSRLLQSVSLRGMSSLVSRDTYCKSGTPEASTGRSRRSSLQPLHEDAADGGEEAGLTSPASATAADGSSGECGSLVGDFAASGAQELSTARVLQDNSFVVLPQGIAAGGGDPDCLPGSTAGGGAAGGGEAAGGQAGQQQGGVYEFEALTDLQCQKELELEVSQKDPAPPVPPEMQHVLDFDLSCTPLEFWSRFLANHSDFLHRFHASRGDTNIHLSKWQRHFKVGMVRDLGFLHPVKARIGPPQAMCHQTQRLSVFSGRHLVLETSQVMSGIPYADHFTVESRWDVAPHGGGSRITVHLHVPFSKKTMWRSFIEKGSYDDVLEAMQRWSQMATERLAEAPSTGLSPGGAVPHSEAEWNALLSKVDPQYRSAIRHMRRHSRAGSSAQGGGGGVHVGHHQLPILARHRRNGSRGDGGALAPLGQRSRPNSRGGSSRSLHQLAEHQELEEPPAGQLQQQQQPEGRQPGSSILPFLLSPVLALVAALLLLLRAAARALGSRRRRELTALACGVVIIAAQAALILQQRQQVADLQVQLAHAASPLAAVAGGRGHQVAAAAAVLGREVSQLQRALQSIQVQLNDALRKAKDLGQQVQHTTAAPAASQTA